MTQFIVGKHKGQRALYRLSGAFLTFLAYLPAQVPRIKDAKTA